MESWEVVFENEHLYIINKKPGVAVQSSGDDSIEALLAQDGKNYKPINRIDQPVSGLTIFGKTAKATSEITELLRTRRIKKEYSAIVQGIVEKESDILTHSLVKIKSKAFVNENGKSAILQYNVLKRLDNLTILKIKIETGRFHQIRCQMSAIGHPIRNDIKYKGKKKPDEHGIYLHCHHLSIPSCDSVKNGVDLFANFPDLPLWKLVSDN